LQLKSSLRSRSRRTRSVTTTKQREDNSEILSVNISRSEHNQKTLPKKQEQTPPNPTKIKFQKKTTEKKRSRSGERVRVSPMKETPLKSQLKPARQQSVTYESNLKIYNEE
jgi:hypothetical protein